MNTWTDSATRGCGCEGCRAYWTSERGIAMSARIDAMTDDSLAAETA